MKLKLIPLLAGAIALTVTAAPLAVKAVTPQASQQIGQVKGMFGKGAGLNLTSEQQAQMTEIRRDTRAQIERILTPEQRQQFQAAENNAQGKRGGLRNLNLDQNQRQQVQRIMQEAKTRAEAVLTNEQRELIQQRRREFQQRRQQNSNSNL